MPYNKVKGRVGTSPIQVEMLHLLDHLVAFRPYLSNIWQSPHLMQSVLRAGFRILFKEKVKTLLPIGKDLLPLAEK